MKSDPRFSSVVIHEWSCGHKAGDCCAECTRLLALKTADLQRVLDNMIEILRTDLPATLMFIKDSIPQETLAAIPELKRGGIDLLGAHAKRAVDDYERTAARWLRGEGSR